MKTTFSILLLLFVPLGLFAKDKSTPTKEKLVVSSQAWTGQKLPPYPSGQPEISILKITIPPGQPAHAQTSRYQRRRHPSR